MPRANRMKFKGEQATYHVVSRTALDGFPLKEAEKDKLFELLDNLRRIYFVEILAYAFMSTHIHIVLRMHPESEYSDADIIQRFKLRYGEDKEIAENQIPYYRERWEDLSEFVKEYKQTFSRYYNAMHDRKGFFWGDRYKSTIVQDGDTLINLCAYVDLNPVRAGIVEKPEYYRWSSMGHYAQTDNKGNLLSLDFGLRSFGNMKDEERFQKYRKFVYETGAMETSKGAKINPKVLKKEQKKDFKLTRTERFRYRTKHFTESGIIGSKEYVRETFLRLKHLFYNDLDRHPVLVAGLNDIYSLKQLKE